MNIQQNFSLKAFNTFGIEAKARFFVEVDDPGEFQNLVKEKVYRDNKVLILGGGSNVLFVNDFDGLVVRNNIKGIELIQDTDNHSILKVGGGEIWQDLVDHCLDHDLGGIENLSLIPGTVGAAPMQNIGAYGVEIKEVFQELEAIDRDSGELRTFNKEDCQFGYRESSFKRDLKGKYFISHVLLKLSKQHELNISYGAIKETLAGWSIASPTIQDVSRAVISIRCSKLPDPADIGNAGSFFKNPIIPIDQYEVLKRRFPGIPAYDEGADYKKVPAGWLIEQAGFKGKRIGDVGVHEKQALVLVNYGNGKGKEIRELAQEIQETIKSTFEIKLIPEVNIIE